MSSKPSVSVSDAIDEIGRPVSVRIDDLLAEEIKRWSRLDPSIAEPLSSLRQLVAAGGKRLRPAFAYWAYRAAGGQEADPAVVDIGAALELLHSFALVHDDVMDDSLRRRGADAVHVQFAKQHERLALQGERRRFGEAVAILVGDMAFVYADLMMTAAPPHVVSLFNEMRIELNIGQYLDVAATSQPQVPLEVSNTIACYKSGKYTVERPMHLGAALANRHDELAEPFSNYGIPIGEAFQFRDDILGAFGDDKVTGKPVGGDIIEGKPTVLVAMARQNASGEDARLLQERYGQADLSEKEIAQLQEVLISTGAEQRMNRRIDELVEKGLGGLDELDIEADARDRLVQLAYFVAGRQH